MDPRPAAARSSASHNRANSERASRLLRGALLLGLAWLGVAGLVACDVVVGEGSLVDGEPDDLQREAEANAAAGFTAISAYRALDTRSGARPSSGKTRCVQVAGRGGVPSSAKAVAVNLVAVAPTGAGYMTAYPSGSSKPGTSTLNYAAGQTRANGALVQVGSGGKICVYIHTASHVVVDVAGYFASTTAYTPRRPYRRLDTRSGSRPGSGSTRCYQVGGRDGIPSTAKAVAINLVAVHPSGGGYLTAYPAGSSRPGTSTLNYAKGQTVANGAIVQLGTGGKLCVYVHTASDIVIDVTGHFGAGAGYTPRAPFRRLDTRSGSRPGSGSTRCYQVAGKNGIPAGAAAVAVNVAAANATGNGYLVLYPDGRQPGTSTLNYAAGPARANNALVKPGAGGKICVYVHKATDYILDVTGYWPGSGTNAPAVEHPHTYKVATKAALLSALTKACCGDVVKIAAKAVIDLTDERNVELPANVKIVGDGVGASRPLIRSRGHKSYTGGKSYSLLVSGGPNVQLRNIRLQGPDGSVGKWGDVMAYGFRARHPGIVVQDCELFNWPSAAVSADAPGVVVRNNFIHDNIRYGWGYGVVVGHTAGGATIIERNTFLHNRHCVAGDGYGSYVVRYNRFLQSDAYGVHSLVDMHGANEHTLDNSTYQAGVFMHIHHNDFEYLGVKNPGDYIAIRGVPAQSAVVEENCIARTDSTWVLQSTMIAYPAPVAGMSCYEKAGVQLCHVPKFGSAMQNIVVRNNHLGRPSGCR